MGVHKAAHEEVRQNELHAGTSRQDRRQIRSAGQKRATVQRDLSDPVVQLQGSRSEESHVRPKGQHDL